MEDWKKDWRPMMDAVGLDFSDGEKTWGADPVEKGAIRRFLEPLEFDCPLHYDKTVADQYGYSDVIAPYSSLLTWTIAAHWYPGEKIFTSSDRNAQPARNPVGGVQTDLEPQTTGFFATDLEFDYLQPVKVGDWLCNNGNVLLSCVPKETKVGRGAFLVWESTICNQHEEEVAKMRIGTYKYNPHTTRMEAN